jgi:hypothetical protein
MKRLIFAAVVLVTIHTALLVSHHAASAGLSGNYRGPGAHGYSLQASRTVHQLSAAPPIVAPGGR